MPILPNNRNKTIQKAILPKLLVKAIKEKSLSKPQQNKVIYFLQLLYRRYTTSDKTFDEFIQLPAKYLEKIFSCRYRSYVIQPLIEWNIIEENPSYSNGLLNKNIWCKSYRINLSLLEGKLIPVKYEKKKYENEDNVSPLAIMVKNSLNLLCFDYDRAMADVNDLARQTVTENFIPGSEIWQEKILVTINGSRKKYRMTIENARAKAESMGMELIGYKDDFFITDVEQFLATKRKWLKLKLQYQALMFKKKFFRASRNKTNNRLDSTLTSFPNKLMPYISMDGQNIRQLDFKNSQFAILGYLLSSYRNSAIIKESAGEYDFTSLLDTTAGNADMKEFCGIVKEGFYEHIQKELNLKKREDAKSLMFLILFSKAGFQSHEKSKLTAAFPSVMKFIDGFKKQYGYKKFSVMLQRLESQIFIDGLLPLLIEAGIVCIPKHDCCCIKESDIEKAEIIIKNYFGDIGLCGKFSDGDGYAFDVCPEIYIEHYPEVRLEVLSTALSLQPLIKGITSEPKSEPAIKVISAKDRLTEQQPEFDFAEPIPIDDFCYDKFFDNYENEPTIEYQDE